MTMYVSIGDVVIDSPHGPGKITGITEAGYPQVNHVAVACLKLEDGRVFDPHGRYNPKKVEVAKPQPVKPRAFATIHKHSFLDAPVASMTTEQTAEWKRAGFPIVSVYTAPVVDEKAITLEEANAALRVQVALLERQLRAKEAVVEQEPKWIVNDNGELGVKVGERFFFMYKGDNLEYEDGVHGDGTPVRWRGIGKNEFGETCWPKEWTARGYRGKERYTLELKYVPGLSFGEPGDFDWRDLPVTKRLKSISKKEGS